MMRASWEEETSLLMQGTSPLAAGTAHHHHHPTLLHGGEGDRYQQHVHQRSNNNNNNSNNAMRTSTHNERTPLLVDGQATAQRINVSASHNNNNNNKSQDIYRRRRMTNQRSHQVMAHAYSVDSSSVFEDQDLSGDNKDRYSSFATKHSRDDDDDDDEDDDQDEDGGQNDEDDDEVNVRFAKKHHLRHQGVVVDDDHDDEPEGQSMSASSGEDDDDDDNNNNNKHHDISAGPAVRSNHNNNNNKHQSRKKSKSSTSSSSWMNNCCWKGGWIKSCRRWYRRRQRSCSTHVFRTHCMICLWQMQTLFRRFMDCTYWIVHDMLWFIHPHDSRGDSDPVSSRSFSVYDANILGCDEDRFRGVSRGVDEIENLKYDDEDDDDNEDLCSFSAWRCSFGTREQDGTWLNVSDRAGTLMALLVWVLILYSAVTMYLLAQDGYLPVSVAVLYMTLAAAALACHAKTALTDPGSIPSSAAPPRHVTMTTMASQSSQNLIQYHAVCAACHTYKPPGAHHCRVCNRCIHRMDHHCPWMNNCIGAGNIKFFLLFLFYTWTSCAVALTVFATNYFGCSVETCQYDGVQLHLVRLMTALCVATVLFTTNIGVNMIYAIMTGVGTIERFQHQQQNQLQNPSSTNNKDGIFQDNMIAVYEAIPFRDIFGAGPIWTWFVPMDPVFYQNDNHDDNDDDDDGGGSQSSTSRRRRRHSHRESDDLERVLGYRLLPGGIQLRDRIQILQMPLSTGGGSVSITTQSLFSPIRNHRMVNNNNNSSKSRSLGTTMTGILDRRHQQLLQHRSDDDDDHDDALWLQQQRQESRRIPVTTTTVNQDDYDI